MLFSHIPELMAILVVGLLVFGPKRLPEIGSSVGRSIRELKHGLNEVGEPVQTVHAQLSADEPTGAAETRPNQTDAVHHARA
ncbi:MAG: twin-arginine translocase TatA/TatE family subunit [Chloroflexota bacterium]